MQMVEKHSLYNLYIPNKDHCPIQLIHIRQSDCTETHISAIINIRDIVVKVPLYHKQINYI